MITPVSTDKPKLIYKVISTYLYELHNRMTELVEVIGGTVVLSPLPPPPTVISMSTLSLHTCFRKYIIFNSLLYVCVCALYVK